MRTAKASATRTLWPASCPFCTRLATGDVLIETPQAVAILDQYPVTVGHALIVSRRHEADFFDLDNAEQAGMWRLVSEVRAVLQADHGPQGFNVGVNVGSAAGQTVAHTHIHVIPRYTGDVEDPRGGVRAVIPARAAWWKEGRGARTDS